MGFLPMHPPHKPANQPSGGLLRGVGEAIAAGDPSGSKQVAHPVSGSSPQCRSSDTIRVEASVTAAPSSCRPGFLRTRRGDGTEEWTREPRARNAILVTCNGEESDEKDSAARACEMIARTHLSLPAATANCVPSPIPMRSQFGCRRYSTRCCPACSSSTLGTHITFKESLSDPDSPATTHTSTPRRRSPRSATPPCRRWAAGHSA